MKRFIPVLLICCFLSANLFSQNNKYSKIQLTGTQPALSQIARLGIPVDEFVRHKDHTITAVLSSGELLKLDAAGITYQVLIPDMTTYYQQRNETPGNNIDQLNASLHSLFDNAGDYTVPEHFSLGSMGGFYTLEEMTAKLDSMAILFPNLATPRTEVSSMTSMEGRKLYYVKISDNPTVNETEPEILFNGLTHAREGIGMQQLVFFMYYLLENYNTNDEIKYLVDNAQIYFLPMMNPDGYVYNQVQNPQGGGMWRKNRRNSGGGNFGIDLNRNFGYMWGYDDLGSSPDPSSETYRGPAAFSEPETQIIKQFCESHNFKMAINFHSYSDLFLYSWSYVPEPSPDNTLFVNYSTLMTEGNHYTCGQPGMVLYITNGDINDWMYGEQTTKPKTFAWVPEVGSENDGFWPMASRIVPLCQENMLLDLRAIHLILSYAIITDPSNLIIPGKQGYFKYDLERLGLDETATYTVSIEPVSANILSVGAAKNYSGLAQFNAIHDSIDYSLDPDILPGDVLTYILKLDNGLYTWKDTVNKYFGTPVVVFDDPCESMENWSSTKWNTTAFKYHSPVKSITDSPAGSYSNYANNSVTMVTDVDLTGQAVAIMNYWARWSVEKGFDWVQVKISTNGGLSWIPLTGKYTVTGNENQAPGEPLYDGMQDEWVKEEIDLHDYLGQPIKIRFTLRSDSYTIDDGFYFDDFTITVVDLSTGIQQPGQAKQAGQVHLSNPIPNPAGNLVCIKYTLDPGTTNAYLLISGGNGQAVFNRKLEGNALIVLNVSEFSPGIYFYRIVSDYQVSETRKLIVY